MDEPLRPPDDLRQTAGAHPQHENLLRHRLHDDRGLGRAGYPCVVQGRLQAAPIVVCVGGGKKIFTLVSYDPNAPLV